MEVLSALSQKFDRIIIGITNPDIENLFEHAASQHRHTDVANPFSYTSRVQIIKDSISELPELDSIEIEIIPFDLTQPDSWAVPAETVFALRIFSAWEASKLDLFTGQGFEVLELPAPATKVSASDIREALTTNDSTWHSLVAPGAISTIQQEWDNATSKVSV
jgi:nicotinamide-nucleotide adenylyltransferase